MLSLNWVFLRRPHASNNTTRWYEQRNKVAYIYD